MNKLPLSLLLSAALVSGCGHSSAVDTDPSETPIPETWPAGIYVAPSTGRATGDGSPTAPVTSINAALAMAANAGLTDVYVFGGSANEQVREVVTLKSGIHLHGSVCTATALTIDTDQCATTFVDASPALVADGLDSDTLVENVRVLALDATSADPATTFQVPGIGCRGRVKGEDAAVIACTPVDTRFPSVAAVFHKSRVILRSVELIAGAAGHGADGLEGADGAAGSAGASNGAAGTNAACPEANAGAGGLAGYFANALSMNGLPGQASAMGGQPGAGSTFVWNWQLANSGANAPATLDDATTGFRGAHGSREIDPLTLAAGDGSNGGRGRSGRGGGGGGGGAAATSKVYEVFMTAAGNYGVRHIHYGGYSEDPTRPAVANAGERNGGIGGGGGAGGCGGEGGTAGTGGASSIGLLVRESFVQIQTSRMAGGFGGNGGIGGTAGLGGNGGAGALGANGGVTAPFRPGSFSNNSWSPNSVSATEFDDGGSSEVRSGKGGRGAAGARGGNGGEGGHGAGGASIAIVSVQSSLTVDPSTALIPGAAGLGGRITEADAAPNGISQTILSIQ